MAAPHQKQHLVFGAIALLLAALVPFVPFMALPGISDDYQQIGLGRDFVSAEGLPKLIGDALYRCRATSLVWTRALDSVVGADFFVHRLGSVLLHALNGGILVLFGSIPAIGYRRAFITALVFLLMNGHQEAIVWVAAVHDLFVFGFAMGSLLCWAHWLRTRQPGWLAAVFSLFLLALYSKESAAILPLLYGATWLVVGERRKEDLGPIFLAPVLSLAYAALVFQAARDHLHLNDGTFSIHAPFWLTLPRTLFRIVMPWSVLAAMVLVWKRQYRVVAGTLAFSVMALLPYSFVTYTTEAPSRHRYWATAGAALLLAWAIDSLLRGVLRWERPLGWALAVTFAIASPAYLWTKKLPQYEQRAIPTEAFLDFARGKTPPVWVEQGPYHAEIYRFTARVMLGWNHGDVKSTVEEPPPPGTAVFEAPLHP
ncbi:MAG: hypothetical protein KIT83_22030 [Bryobacterales bacterium]|nr:hypothetical protein [Bryobacterales bacterium]